MQNNGITYESSIRYLVEKSNQRAWVVAFAAVCVSVLSIMAITFMLPLKTVEPYVIRVDNTTGMVDIITSVDKETLTSNEALDKYFTSKYVKTREGYFYNLLQEDYILTQILSSPEVSKDYIRLYEGSNSRVEVLQNKEEISIDIVSVTLGVSAGIKTATIRFNAKQRLVGSDSYQNSAKIATLSYDYSPQSLSNEDERLKNPLGFKVLTYRIDEEVKR